MTVRIALEAPRPFSSFFSTSNPGNKLACLQLAQRDVRLARFRNLRIGTSNKKTDNAINYISD